MNRKKETFPKAFQMKYSKGTNSPSYTFYIVFQAAEKDSATVVASTDASPLKSTAVSA